jgi:hypothetical protein
MKSLLLPLLLVACVQATISDTATLTNTIDQAVPVPPVGIMVPPTTLSQSYPVDISDAISKITSVGTPALSITSNHLHSNMGDFSFFQEITITGSVADSGTPTVLADIILSPTDQAGSDIDVPVLVDGATMLTLFEAGSVDLTFNLTVSGTPPASGQLDLTSTIGLNVSLSVSKSVNDIGK